MWLVENPKCGLYLIHQEYSVISYIFIQTPIVFVR
jgi:hypothetical protein